jgi:hypothetical protein
LICNLPFIDGTDEERESAETIAGKLLRSKRVVGEPPVGQYGASTSLPPDPPKFGDAEQHGCDGSGRAAIRAGCS